MNTIGLSVEARNPGAFLAGCGLIEFVSRVDGRARSRWIRTSDAGVVGDRLEIETAESAQGVVQMVDGLGRAANWKAVTGGARAPLADAVGHWCAGIEYAHDLNRCVVADHWYERAFLKGSDIVSRVGTTRDGKSRWKFWAGQHDAKGVAYLVRNLVAKVPSGGSADVTTLVGAVVAGGSILNNDAAYTRSSIDRGISANDAASELPDGTPGRPALELLAFIGASTFFPPRRVGDGAPDGTVGFEKRMFEYCTWSRFAPVAIARLLARGGQLAGWPSTPFQAPIGMMGQYTYLRLARPAGAPGDSLRRDADELIPNQGDDDE